MSKRLIDISALENTLKEFTEERNWEQYHSPKNLAMALTAEVGELIEIFQWLTEDESKDVANSTKTEAAIRDELADVFLYLVQLAMSLGVDLNSAITAKIERNAKKYPKGDSTPTR